MRIGVNPRIDERKRVFYEMNYDIIPTPNFNDSIRLLKPNHGIKYLGSQSRKECRFCHRQEPDVTFKKIAHVFPESIGNKALASYYECDSCNTQFGETIENDYGSFFQFYHSFAGIRGKRGIPKVKSKTGVCDKDGNFFFDFELFWEPVNNDQGEELCLKLISNVPIENRTPQPNTIVFEENIAKCCPIAVFKTLVKMAITVLPFTEIELFQGTIKWLLDTNHTNIYQPKSLVVRYLMIPGFKVTKYPHFIVFRRKYSVWNLPYMLFNLTYGNFSLLIEVPRDNDKQVYNLSSIPFPPIPFYTSTESVWDLSEAILKENATHTIQLQFDAMHDITQNTDMVILDGKRKVSYNNQSNE